MTLLIRDYRNLPGEHCGTTAMRNLIYHYCGLDLSEALVFGLGSGIDCVYVESDDADPARMVFGRSVTMEVDAALALKVDYREQPELDDERAWAAVRQEVEEGRPTMLSGDIFYLDYRDYEVHFPGHRFVLVGLDDERRVAWIADRIDAEPQPCSYGALAESRSPAASISTFNLWGKFHDTIVHRSREAAVGFALRRTAGRMLGEDESQVSIVRVLARGRPVAVAAGLSGLRRIRERLPGWLDRDDAPFLLRYAGQVIEDFGTGGGNFRKMYAAFLRQAREIRPDLVTEPLPDLAERSAGLWTALSGALKAASREGSPDRLRSCTALLDEIFEVEERLFESIADRTVIGRGSE